MGRVQSFKDLTVWQKALPLAAQVYRVTGGFPASERSGLSAQMRRAAVSIPSNIAEGHTRRSRKEFERHLDIALASAAELETQLLLAERVGYTSGEAISVVVGELTQVQKMLRGLMRSLGRAER